MRRTILLFDVDGVLIHPRGYKEAQRATLDHFAARMGQPPVGLTYDEIALFEACGMTNEWDSLPLAVSLLLVEALSQRPDLARQTLADTMAAIRESGVRVARPDFAPLSYAVLEHDPSGMRPNPGILPVVQALADEAVHPLLDELLGDVHSIHTPTTCLFQQYTLGSERFTRTYGMPADLETESYLSTYDVPLLNRETREHLLAHVAEDGWHMAVFTARPSLPPTDLPDADRERLNPHLYSPEAELAADLLGLDGVAPFMSWGRVAWLAEQHGKEMGAYVKPSPVHALAAIGAALSGEEVAALEAAATLVEEGRVTGPLARLASGPARVVVFEDAVGGILGAREGVERLRRAGLDVTFEGVGVAPEASKQESLRRVAGVVADDINQALTRYLI